MKKLTTKQQLFVSAYLTCGYNATEAASRAGYKGTRNTLRVVGSQNFAKPAIREAIDAGLREHQMGRDEVLALVASHARARFGPLAEALEAGSPSEIVRRAERAGMDHLIRKIRQTKDGALTIELVDSQAALRDLLKVHRIVDDGAGVADRVLMEIARRVSEMTSDELGLFIERHSDKLEVN